MSKTTATTTQKPLTPAEREQAVKRCEKQVVEIVLTAPFFANLLLNLKRSYDDNVPTMCTDGVRLIIGPAFVHKLPDEQIRGVLVHEALHCAFGHPWRRGERDPLKWNYATDYAINENIEAAIAEGARFALPEGCLLDKSYYGLSSEAIYPRLPEPPKGQGGGGGIAPGGIGQDIMDGDNPGGKSNEEMIAEWKGKLVQAAQAARMQGNLPACMDRLVGELISPKVPWRQVLRRFLTDLVRADYDWMRPDRRFLPDDIYIPDLGYEEAAGEIVVVVDTSGSIDDEMLTAFASEFFAIHRELKPSKLHVIYCDAAVHKHDEFAPDDTIIIQREGVGGGGTSFAPVFDFVEEKGVRPKAMVYLTDLYGDHWNQRPTFPVLWACWSDQTDVPFGEVITVEA